MADGGATYGGKVAGLLATNSMCISIDSVLAVKEHRIFTDFLQTGKTLLTNFVKFSAYLF